MIKNICKINNNFLSFLCGICSNIPITFLFSIKQWGNNLFEHTYFLVWIFSFVISIFLTIFAFSFAICKFSIQKKIDDAEGGLAKSTALDDELDTATVKGKNNRRKLKISLIGSIITGTLLFLSLITLWVLVNFI